MTFTGTNYGQCFRNLVFSKEFFCKHEHCNLSTAWQFKDNTKKAQTHTYTNADKNICKHTDTTHIHIDIYPYIDICIHIYR